MRLSLETVAEWMGGRVVGAPGEAVVESVGIDSRAAQPGRLFFAIHGPNFDGHDFVADAFDKGAVGAVVAREEALAGRPGVVVADPRRALGDLAHQYRWQGHLIPWIAITGSNGKTTTRELAVHILRRRGPVCSPRANFNNDLGLPLTILGCQGDEHIGVLEMGMNAPGEIGRLADIATPTVGVVTGIGRAHLEGLGTVEAIAHEKASLFERLPHDGVAIYPAQDRYAPILREHVRGNCATFAVEAPGDMVAEEVAAGERGLCFKVRGVRIDAPLLGLHNVGNILAALLAVEHFGVSLEDAAEALATFHSVDNRMERIDTKNLTILNDCYNASPESLRAAVETMMLFDAPRRVAIVGDMRELGEGSRASHREMGLWMARAGLDVLLVVGREALALAEAAEGGSARLAVRHFRTVQALLGHMNQVLQPGDLVLVKGSRGMHLERVVKSLRLYTG